MNFHDYKCTQGRLSSGCAPTQSGQFLHRALCGYPMIQSFFITKTCLFKYIENFTSKSENFQIKNSGIFHISAQNIDGGYSLELPRRGGSNEYP